MKKIVILSTSPRNNSNSKGWIECFDKASFKGYVFGGGVTDIGDIKEKESLKEAYEMGFGIN